MYKNKFGKKDQIRFDSEHDFFKFLGFLAKNDGSTRIVWEKNKQSGAYEDEGRIQFFVKPPKEISKNISLTAGVGNILSRVNCNEFTENIVNNYNYVYGGNQDVDQIKDRIPDEFINDFENGLKL